MTHSLSSSSSLLWMLVMGLTGSLHCVGMCGGLVTAVSMSAKKNHRSGLWLYQIGRITTYSTLGLLLGLTGLAWHQTAGDEIQRFISIIAGILMIFFAIHLSGLLPDPLQRISHLFSQRIGLIRLVQSLSQHARLRGWYALGLVNGLLPCGLVYAALAMATASGSAMQATLMMLAFGLGTIPAMMFVPTILQHMSPALRLHSIRLAALLVFIMGGITIFRATMSMHHAMG